MHPCTHMRALYTHLPFPVRAPAALTGVWPLSLATASLLSSTTQKLNHVETRSRRKDHRRSRHSLFLHRIHLETWSFRKDTHGSRRSLLVHHIHHRIVIRD